MKTGAHHSRSKSVLDLLCSRIRRHRNNRHMARQLALVFELADLSCTGEAIHDGLGNAISHISHILSSEVELTIS